MTQQLSMFDMTQTQAGRLEVGQSLRDNREPHDWLLITQVTSYGFGVLLDTSGGTRAFCCRALVTVKTGDGEPS